MARVSTKVHRKKVQDTGRTVPIMFMICDKTTLTRVCDAEYMRKCHRPLSVDLSLVQHTRARVRALAR